MTPEERKEIESLLPLARSEAAKYGSLHSGWDTIFDAEALLENRKSIVTDVATIIKYLKNTIGEKDF